MRLFLASAVLSIILSIAGFMLGRSAYYEKLCVLAAKNEIEFIRNMPSLADGSTLKMPVYRSVPLFENNSNISGMLVTGKDPIYVSLRWTKAKVSAAGIFSAELYSVIDARVRK